MKKIVIVAGDSSGDLYGAKLAEKLKNKFSSIEIFSFAGPHLAKHSTQPIDLIKHSVSGIVEVFSNLKEIINTFNETFNKINEINPDLVILIDFPDFNLRLAKKINRKFPIFYYVSPQVWAWRKNRVKLIKRYIEKMVVIFKFEEEFYKKENMDVLYFGHPLLEIIKDEKAETKNIISLLPGSRENEVKKHLPIMLKAKEITEKELKNYQFRIIRPKNLDESLYKELSGDIEIIPHSYKAIKESKFIVAASGTATVEISILEVPYIIIYKTNPLTWQILKRMVNIKFAGMANILSGKQMIDELLQDEATEQKI